MKSMRTWITWFSAVAVMLLGAFVVYAAQGEGDEGGSGNGMAATEPRPVVITMVERLDVGEVREYPGSTRACSEAELAFRVGGPLVAVDVNPGTEVVAGQLLMQIDPRDYEDNIRVLEAQLAGAVATRDASALDLERLSRLLEQRAVSQSDYDDLKAAYDGAAASVRGLEAQLSIARHKLEDTSLRAPFDGVVTAQHVENHEMVTANQVVLKMQDISKLEIDVNVPENEMPLFDLQQGVEALVAFSSLPDREFVATLEEWSAEAVEVTRTYAVTFVLEAPTDVRILPGMTAEVFLSTALETGGPLVIPASAVGTDSRGGSIVWIYDPDTGTARPHAVTTGALAGHSRVVVLEGLEQGELVVAAGMDFIEEGMLLRPLAAQ